MGECAKELRTLLQERNLSADANMGGGVQKDAHLAQAGDTRFFRNLLQGGGWDEWHCMTSQTHNT